MFKESLFALGFTFIVFSQERASDTILNSSFGALRYAKKTESGTNELLFNNNAITNPFPFGRPSIIGKWDKNTSPFEEIIILQESGVGQACNDIGNFHFLGITQTGNTEFLRDSVQGCGVSAVADHENSRMIIDQINSVQGQVAYIPCEVWKYANGRVFRADSNPPVIITFRVASLDASYVAQIRNNSPSDTLNLWFSALGKKSSFVSLPKTVKEIGWAEGYRIAANNSVSVGGEKFATLKCVPPKEVLAGIQICWTDDGLGLSFSQQFLQSEANALYKPIRKQWLQVFTAELTNAPEILLNENSDRLFAKAKISISFLTSALSYKVFVDASGVPYYSPESKGIYLNNIQNRQYQS
ncbi:MAG TPA: hypothetical protein VKF42_00635 [Chitinivibrionales bacterium]|nr:hypothetical protein [Chitinivibrionales bacterium]